MSGWWNLFKDEITGSFERKHIQVRQGFAAARRILYETDELFKGSKELKEAVKGKLKKEVVPKYIKQGAARTKTALLKLQEDMQAQVKSEVLIIHFILETIREVMVEDERIKAQVPVIGEYEKKFRELYDELDTVIYQMQNWSQRIKKVQHKKHFFPRDEYHKLRHLLKDETKLEKGMKKFHAAITGHILYKLKRSEEAMRKRIHDMVHTLKNLLADTLALIYIVLETIKDEIKNDDRLREHFPEIVREEAWLKNEFAKIQGAAAEQIRELRAAARFG